MWSCARQLKYAGRPSWVEDSDRRAEKCMESKQPFTFFDRKHHCRRCGGAFRSDVMVQQPCVDIKYDGDVGVCNPCATKSKRRSRWIKKLPKHQRGVKEQTELNKAADAVRQPPLIPTVITLFVRLRADEILCVPSRRWPSALES
jgi:hypothetical protein